MTLNFQLYKNRLYDTFDQLKWSEKGPRTSGPFLLTLNMMNGGLTIPIEMSHIFPMEYYGQYGTYGTNRFVLTIGLRLAKQESPMKLEETHIFFPDAIVSFDDTAVYIVFPSNEIFDRKHTVTDTIAFFRKHLAGIYYLVEYLQAQQPV